VDARRWAHPQKNKLGKKIIVFPLSPIIVHDLLIHYLVVSSILFHCLFFHSLQISCRACMCLHSSMCVRVWEQRVYFELTKRDHFLFTKARGRQKKPPPLLIRKYGPQIITKPHKIASFIQQNTGSTQHKHTRPQPQPPQPNPNHKPKHNLNLKPSPKFVKAGFSHEVREKIRRRARSA
jgi:hypothetical protein